MRFFTLIVFSLLGLALLAPAPRAAATPPLVCTTVDFAGALDWDATDHGLPHMAGYYVRQLAGEYDMLEIRYRIAGGTAAFGYIEPTYTQLQSDLAYVFRDNAGDAVFEYCTLPAPTSTPTSTPTSAPATATATSTPTITPAPTSTPTSAPATATATIDPTTTSTPNTTAIPMVTFNAPPVAPLDTAAMLPAMNQIAGAVVDLSATPIGMFALALIGLGSLFEGLWFLLAR